MRRYRRAKRIIPGLWITYANTFIDYPSEYQKADEKHGRNDEATMSLEELRWRLHLSGEQPMEELHDLPKAEDKTEA